MASIIDLGGGRRAVQFNLPGETRKTVRLGKIAKHGADTIKARVEALVAAKANGVAIDADAAKWLGDIGDELHERLAAAALVAPRIRSRPRLKEFTTAYIAGRQDIKPRTRSNLEICAARLVEFFKADRYLADIKPGDADDFCSWMRSRYAAATTARTIKRAKQFFQAAVRKDTLAKNPFADCKAGQQSNQARVFYVTQEAAQKVLAACPDLEWRLIFALARYGGLRCPSEVLALEWPDVDWERGRLRVTSVKTEQHEGGAERWIPLFPELRPLLEAAFEQAPEGAVHVVSRHRDQSCNLRTHLRRIIRRAGLVPWERTFHNLRATRQTELAATFPLHVVCAWIGNKRAVAAEHYLSVTDADFDRAAKSAAKALQKAAHRPTTPETATAGDGAKTPEKPDNPQRGGSGRTLAKLREHPRQDSNPGEIHGGNESFAESAAKGAAISEGPGGGADLARLVEAWPQLPEAVRRDIMAMVDSACP